MDAQAAYEAEIDQRAEQAALANRLIEVGFLGLQKLALPVETPPEEIAKAHDIFFAGAAHLFFLLMRVLDPASEDTESDLKHMEAISQELQQSQQIFARYLQHAKGQTSL